MINSFVESDRIDIIELEIVRIKVYRILYAYILLSFEANSSSKKETSPRIGLG